MTWNKRTTGITGLWQPSVHSDVAFWSFDVGSSYHTEAEFGKRWIVHPLDVYYINRLGGNSDAIQRKLIDG